MLRHLALLALLLAPAAVRAEPLASCTPLFVGGQAPALLNTRLAERAIPLCYRAYAVLASGVTRGALWSAEHPTAAGLAAARQTQRVNLFHPDDDLPPADRAELADYARSGFDRGHMTPSGDMPDPVAQQESFSLANIVPQTAKLNRGVWEQIESAVRTLVKRRGEAYVVTGPAFQRGGNLQQIGGRVLVPTSTWKAIYVPATGDVGAWSCTNTATPACTVLSVADLTAQTGVDPFPGLSQSVKATLGRLPLPRPSRNY
ncbi:MAG: DNA/RNA non-specific endonuclease [Janthinobacterium lividum]